MFVFGLQSCEIKFIVTYPPNLLDKKFSVVNVCFVY